MLVTFFTPNESRFNASLEIQCKREYETRRFLVLVEGVSESSVSSGRAGAIAGGVVGAVLAVVILLMVIVVIVVYRQYKSREANTQGMIILLLCYCNNEIVPACVCMHNGDSITCMLVCVPYIGILSLMSRSINTVLVLWDYLCTAWYSFWRFE